MQTFNLKSLLGWEPCANLDLLVYETFGKTRNIAFTVNTTAKVAIYASFYEDMSEKVLLACADGMFDVGFSSAIDVYVQFICDPEAEIYVRGPSADHVVPKVDEPIYTSVEPQGRRNSDLDRMMFMMKMNEKRRDEILDNAIRELKADKSERRADKADAKAERKADKAKEETPVIEEETDDEKDTQDAKKAE